MRNIKEDLRTIGVDERIIEHPAINVLFGDALTFGVYRGDGYSGQNVNISDNEIVIYDDANKPLYRIKNDALGLELIKCDTLDSSKVKVLDNGLVSLENVNEKNKNTNEFSERLFGKDGLEVSLAFGYASKQGAKVVTRRAYREPNGYVVNVALREEKFDEIGQLLPVNELGECHGYLDVDPRFATLLISTGKPINYDNAIACSAPHKYNSNDLNSPEINDILKQYIAASLNDPDEYRRWSQKYEQGLIISGDTVKMGR